MLDLQYIFPGRFVVSHILDDLEELLPEKIAEKSPDDFHGRIEQAGTPEGPRFHMEYKQFMQRLAGSKGASEPLGKPWRMVPRCCV